MNVLRRCWTVVQCPCRRHQQSDTNRREYHNNNDDFGDNLGFGDDVASAYVRALFDFNPVEPGDLEFKAGDILQIVNKDSDDWWTAQHTATSETGAIPRNYVVIHRDKTNIQDWWFDVNRNEAETLLMLPGNRRGAFLIRQCTDKKSYVLSIRDFDETTSDLSIRHYRIHRTDNGLYFITKLRTFVSIEQLVDHYSGHVDALCHKLTAVCQRRPELVPFKKFEVNRDEIQLEHKLGSGKFGEVWKGTWRNKIDIAVKKLSSEGRMTAEQFLQEAEILHRVRHQHLVMLMGVCTVGTPIYIIMELLKHGNLLDYLRKCARTEVTFEILMTMVSQVVDGMAHLEQCKCLHRDLRAANVLVGDNYTVKIADVGLARLLIGDVYDITTEAMWPVRWTAPEAYLRQQFSTKSDVWSFGVLLYEIVTYGIEPYAGMSNREVKDDVCDGHRMRKPGGCPESLYEKMLQCWQADPDDRPTFADLLNHFRPSSYAQDVHDDS